MKYLLLLLCPILMSCGASGPRFTNSAPAAGRGRVIVYRVPSTPGGRAANVTVDGRRQGRLKMKGYLAYDLQPGRHIIGMTFDKSSTFGDVTPASQEVHVGNGGKVFLRYSTKAVYGGPGMMIGNVMMPDYTMHGILSHCSEVQALPEVRRYNMGEPSR
ncbi:DUF2846 domain-containing protein [Luteolibacter yonseiensis]|uniref:DUF2846 domain-containing protein n=1 Tax=Luteolibacter yonseiensis TaxID=1144680 RepID=A0A934RAU2_9BACT|nr:DUF2846 domain-containing protein [Luteolibacter yonseiensis]MBK1818179.1 DUF2846 domain-containing protein [Luteolibacter yonseiensis]